MIGVALLGCTGSIGRSALNVLERHADEFRVVALAAHRNVPELMRQLARHPHAWAAVVDEDAARANGPLDPRVRTGRAALLEAATHPDAAIIVNAVVGAAGLEATLAGLLAGRRLALANKESLVAGGPLVREALRRGGGELIPVDSEHSAILQCLHGAPERSVQFVRRMILTASGGPFREWPLDRLRAVTPGEALRHPTWDMGDKITIDSATLANKALEVVEAHHLFDVAYDDIDVVVHPQSVIHSMVEFIDGSVLAQLGFPDMEVPILYALTHPRRLADDGTRRFDPVAAGALTFEPVDVARFRAFGLGVAAGRAGGTAPAVFNAANEIAVAGFLAGAVSFTGIADVIERALDAHDPARADSLDTVLAADRCARQSAAAAMRQTC
jgi:1-deoxy-D-xylulose-5-phosphate reductoisomerase